VAFSARSEWTGILSRIAPLLLLSFGSLTIISGGQANPVIAIGMVGLLFIVAVALHGRLYALRPDPRQLTLFYFVVAAGGMLGGVFAALVAPAVFDGVYEHPVLLMCAAELLPLHPLIPPLVRLLPDGPSGSVAAALLVLVAAVLGWLLAGFAAREQPGEVLGSVVAMLVLGVAVIGVRWAYVAVLVLLMVGNGGLMTLQTSFEGDRTRSYFGIYTVEEVMDGRMRQLSHGTTVHGRQWLEPGRQLDPTTYYGPSAGIGAVLSQAPEGAAVGVVGLGAGTLACYRKPAQDWTFFEIDPQMLAYSGDRTFTFLDSCTPDARVLLGDARLILAEEPADRFDILAIDAFSSDSIPMHLLTEEAFGTYSAVLRDDGLLMVHISNRFIDLSPMIAALAQASGWHGRVRSDLEALPEGLSPSVWIALAREEERVAQLEASTGLTWSELPAPARRAWTDDNASILPLIRW